MRFSEIADSKYPTLTDTDVAELFDEIDELWPDPIGDDDVSRQPRVGPPTREQVVDTRNEMLVTRHWLNQQRR
jgi:hypothetical protein